jgi:hypothetical protein
MCALTLRGHKAPPCSARTSRVPRKGWPSSTRPARAQRRRWATSTTRRSAGAARGVGSDRACLASRPGAGEHRDGAALQPAPTAIAGARFPAFCTATSSLTAVARKAPAMNNTSAPSEVNGLSVSAAPTATHTTPSKRRARGRVNEQLSILSRGPNRLRPIETEERSGF